MAKKALLGLFLLACSSGSVQGTNDSENPTAPESLAEDQDDTANAPAPDDDSQDTSDDSSDPPESSPGSTSEVPTPAAPADSDADAGGAAAPDEPAPPEPDSSAPTPPELTIEYFDGAYERLSPADIKCESPFKAPLSASVRATINDYPLPEWRGRELMSCLTVGGERLCVEGFNNGDKNPSCKIDFDGQKTIICQWAFRNYDEALNVLVPLNMDQGFTVEIISHNSIGGNETLLYRFTVGPFTQNCRFILGPEGNNQFYIHFG